MEFEASRVIDALPGLVWTALPDGQIDYLNQRWCQYTGLDLQEASGWGWQSAIHPDDLPELLDRWRAIVASGEPGEMEARLRRFDGKYRWFLISSNPLRADAGKVVKWCGVNADIEDYKRSKEALQSVERDLTSMIDTIPTTAWATRPDGFCEFLNQRWLDYAGFTAEQARGWGWGAAIHPDDLEALVDYWRSCLATGAAVDTEARMRRYDGVYRRFLFRANPLRDESGAIIKWYGTNVDIEDRKQAEDALRRALEQLAEGQRLSKTGTFTADLQMDQHEWSEEYYRIFEIDPATQPSVGAVRERVHADDLELFDAEIQRGMEGGGSDFIFRIITPIGGLKYLRGVARLVEHVAGRPIFMGTVQDITERKRAEAAKAAQAQLAGVRADVSAAFSETENLSVILNSCAEAIVRHLDAAFARIWTLSESENILVLQASAGLDTRLDGTHARVPVGQLEIGRIAEEGKPHLTNDMTHDERVSDPDWARREGVVAFAGYPLLVEGRVTGVLAMFARRPFEQTVLNALESVADIIAQGIYRREAEEKLRRSEAFLATGQRLSRTGSFYWQMETGEITWSEELYRIFGFDHSIPVTLERIASRVPPEELPMLSDMIERAQRAASDFEYEHRVVMPDHTIKYVHLTAHTDRDPQGRLVYIGAAQEITRRRLAEEALGKARSELAHAARVSSLGELAASIAHEVNQPLAAIVTNANACLRWLNRASPNLDEAREAAQRIVGNGKRGGEVISRIRMLLKNEAPSRTRVEINEIIRTIVGLAKSELSGTDLRLNLAAQLPFVSADDVQLQQVLLNLILNAVDAMRSLGDCPRVLRIITEPHEGDAVLVAVQDSGAGLQAESFDQLFEAFFTTKSKGLGIGLSISRSIIESHGGRLWAEPNDGPGVTFKFTLPAEKGALA
jgi:PAS domain S-box-containing protein